MSYTLTPTKGDAFCGFCKRNNWHGDTHEAKDAAFRTVEHTANGYQHHVFTICDTCAAQLSADLQAFIVGHTGRASGRRDKRQRLISRLIFALGRVGRYLSCWFQQIS